MKKRFKVLAIIGAVIGFLALTYKQILAFILLHGVHFFVVQAAHEVDLESLSSAKFDRAVWLNAVEAYKSRQGRTEEYYPCVMGHMYNDLVNNYLSVGIPMETVKILIGVPIGTRQYSKWLRKITCWEYRLGACGYGATKIMLICPDSLGKKISNIFYSNVDDDGIIITNYDCKE